MNVLIAEDERDIRDLLRITLQREGYTVFAAVDGLEALHIVHTQSIDIAVLDVMMPRLDGYNLLRRIRPDHTFPVIFLTARGDDMDKVLGLGLGADDYLVKPFSMAELLARMGAQLRRSRQYGAGAREPVQIRRGGLVLDKAGCSLSRDSVPVELSAKQYRLLEYLMDHPARVFTKKQLYRAVWDEEAFFDDNTVMVHISQLRNKIEDDPKNPRYILTVRGIGYKFAGDGESGL